MLLTFHSIYIRKSMLGIQLNVLSVRMDLLQQLESQYVDLDVSAFAPFASNNTY